MTTQQATPLLGPVAHRKGYLRFGAMGLCLGVALMYSAMASALTKTYTIEESTDFTGNGCGGVDVNTITSSLRTALDNHSWSGSRWVNSSSWPQDYIESCNTSYGSGGLDGTYGDVRSLNVFAGHGDFGQLFFGHARDNRCDVDLSTNSRLGTLDGDSTVVAMYLACRVLRTSQLAAQVNHQWVRQQLGYNNYVSIGDNEPRDFFNDTDTKSNAQAWLDRMDGGSGWDDSGNSEDREPVVVSYSNSSSYCWAVMDNATLHDNRYLDPRVDDTYTCGGGTPRFYYCYRWIENN